MNIKTTIRALINEKKIDVTDAEQRFAGEEEYWSDDQDGNWTNEQTGTILSDAEFQNMLEKERQATPKHLRFGMLAEEPQNSI